jgi:ribosomal RNA-processing protein 17
LYQLREERRQELEAHIEAVNALLAEAKTPDIDDSDDSEHETWNGILDSHLIEPIDHEAEYIDEDRYTTVTVEAVDVSKEGLHRVVKDTDTKEEESSSDPKTPTDTAERKTGASRKIWPKKTRKKKFRYESKAERKATRGKQKAGNKVKADARRGAS